MSDSETIDASSSSSSSIASMESNPSQLFPNRETLIVASPITLEEEETQSDSCSDLPDDPWKLTPSPSYETDDSECSKPEKEIHHHHLPYNPTGVGIGILNLGNSCFLNSVLQCLTHTVPFVQTLGAYGRRPCNCERRPCVMIMIQEHIRVALLTYMKPMSPSYFLKILHYFSPDFRPGQQQDAQEFLQEFLDKLERCCLTRNNNNNTNVNVVENVFGGRLMSTLRCCNCGSDSKTYEPSVGISLEIIGDDVDDLRDALESFTRLEELDEKLTCDNCNEKVSKEKKLSLDKIPQVAMFHLKRFKNNGYSMEKIFKQVTFPLELDLYPYMNNNNENQEGNTKYHLYAFVEHLGTLGYGHYCAYVRSAPKTWHKFDDDKVIRIEEDYVVTRTAYMLFYVKKGTPWFSRAFEEMHSLREEDNDHESVLDPTNGECVSEISYEKGEKSNYCVKTQENSVSVSKSSNDEDSPMDLDMFETNDDSLLVVQDQVSSTKQQEEILPSEIEHMETEKSQQESCTQPMTSDVEETVPRDLVTKQQEETLQSEMETEKSQQGSCEQPIEAIERDIVTKAPTRARELVQATSETGSPPKKFQAV